MKLKILADVKNKIKTLSYPIILKLTTTRYNKTLTKIQHNQQQYNR